MVIEGVVTTENQDGSIHVSPIGPHVNDALTQWMLKPFQSSTSFSNLRRTNRCVFHVTDDALLMAVAVLGLSSPNSSRFEELRPRISKGSQDRIEDSLSTLRGASLEQPYGWCLQQANRIFALTIDRWDVSEPRALAFCSLAMQRELRPFWGWNRAKHSILELSVVASRVHMLAPTLIEEQLKLHQVVIEKTAGPSETAAWELLNTHLSQ
jgi:hypothetical protein